MTDKIDCVVIGAGVVGLAIARSLALAGREVIVLEKNARIGEETSSRNSEVVHGGLYYAEDSLKAKLCVEGKHALYDYCERKNIGHNRCGKIVFAINDGEKPRLENLAARARHNGVDDVELLTAAEVKAREPVLDVAAGLWSPSTGIVDIHALMLALHGDIEASGGSIALLSEFTEAHVESNGVRIRILADGDRHEILAGDLINAAGLHADRVARAIHGFSTHPIPSVYYAKGNYFAYHGANPFSHLVYPIPVDGGLGIHGTLDLSGRLRFGPDVEWIDEIDYRVNGGRAATFCQAIGEYWPGVDCGKLSPSYSGIRPKLTRAGEPPADFAVLGPYVSQDARLVHLLGIESPGLTSALAIGELIRRELA